MSDNSTLKFYKQVVRKHVVNKLREQALRKLHEIRQESARVTVRRERNFLKTAPRTLPNKARKRLRKRAAK